MSNLELDHNYNARRSPSGRKERTEMVYIRGIPADIKHEFKSYCAQRGWTMTEAVIKMMRIALKKDHLPRREKPKPPRGPKPLSQR